jgi:manganese/zinc/iron transport system substrate-binding protein
MKYLFLFMAMLGLGFAAGAEAPPVRVVATVGMLADVAREVAGPHAEVSGLIGEGIDPHVYKPTRRDVQWLGQAELILYNGLLLEGKMGDVLTRLGRSGKPVVAVGERIGERRPGAVAGEGHETDPHLWMDVALWSEAAAVIGEALTAYRPELAEPVAVRVAAYQERLAKLDRYVREVIDSIPPEQRVLITAHDAFHYFGAAYGIEVLGIQGISTESEAGLNDINRLVDLLVERRIGAVFVESSVADRNVRALVEGARSRGHAVTIGGSLFSDAMGTTGTWEGTYLGMLDHNATTIARALGGTAPAGGFRAWEQAEQVAP